ncbi:hypothetical protein BGZ80_002166 [Entomortierella chlamydospora]|uniref:Glycosyltransferase family 34 protein n=1 Tax=Entomortierella chlamydospora TaxID=101097 RepID=A0A9P6MQ66_9FUNG|nr:hypothetical protein BGZ79_011031 [Entomortierella chlamydospora]KAG0009675.1 hypothetical protein BGZ80_002166 [Entomortierella chlamydospora]
MAMPVKRLYLVTAAIFIIIVILSYHKNNLSYDGYGKQVDTPSSQADTQNYDTSNSDYSDYNNANKEEKPDTIQPTTPKPETETEVTTAQLPNTSGKYDTLILIPSSWTQIQNRKWVRQTLFGIKDNIEPCKKYNGRIIYKFYIHGHATWLKTNIHSAEFMQGQVRDLYSEFMEYTDYTFVNKTVTDRHALWGDALTWAVETFIPEEKIQVENVLVFDSTTLVNLPKIEASAKLVANAEGFIYTWGEPTLFAGMASYSVVEQIVKNRNAIKENHNLLDIFTAATLYFTHPAQNYRVEKGVGQLWASDIDQIEATTEVVGQVYQLDDWTPIVEKLAIKTTPACAADPDRKKNIAVLTSSYVYADMCMAEASLPSAENKRTYAIKHGYDFVARAAEFAQEEHRGRKLVWGKIGAIQKVLPHYEWLFWMDMDALVADLDKDVRDIIREAEDKKENNGEEISLIVVRPVRDRMLNAGVMLIKNTDWSRRFFNEVQTKVDWYRKSSYEQAAIWGVMTDPKWSSGVYFYDGNDHVMNTFPKQYQEGDFIVHFAPAGCPSVPVLEALRKIKNGESILGVGTE